MRWSFHTKVLAPVIGTMVLLVLTTMWIVNRRITDQIEAAAGRELVTANAVFKNSQAIRARNLLRRYQNVPNEPRFKAVTQLGDAETLRFLLSELLDELGGELVVFTTVELKPLARAARLADHAPAIKGADFDAPSALSIKAALAGDAAVDTVRVGNRLFDLISVPVVIGANIVGALTFATEVDDAVVQEFKQLTHAEVVLVVGEQIAASTLQGKNLPTELSPAIQSITQAASRTTHRQVQIGGEHFLYHGGRFTGLGGDQSAGYLLLLSSYEQPLQVLAATQRMLGLLSLASMALSILIIHGFLRKVTQPLVELRNSAEAVGKGDFSRHVQVRSRDECGELAQVFNQMTANLKTSREQLETTVETLKTTQEQLVQSEKLAGIGEFVAGVTHELNNPLTTVIGFAELLQQSQIDAQHRRFLDHIVNAAQRCHKIVQSLLSFARQHKPERKLVNLHELVEGAIGILAYQMRTSNIQAVTKFDPHLPKVMADPHQLQQVFLNLINNARQAIEAYQPKGLITVTSERCGTGVRLLFQDSGPGISEQNIKKIFDPFFTTKPVGKGTGLGLSLSYGIIQEHGGTIGVRSKEGEGTTFIIELPAADASASSEASSAPATVMLNGHGKRVLLVDDEDAILSLLQEALGPNGCQLDIARDGESALDRLKGANYDAMICDWKMPGLNGQQVYQRLHEHDPAAAAKIIFITGDIVNESTREFIEQRGNRYLSKPFSLDEVRAAVSEVLKAA